ncbi:hypothetical protein ABZT06_22365 [Streptomyces sp. NPDC005483]|uniref:hypothetical protein n=1 Tax=Streptomyces sp. NPDC005483 TaxID=3154882 RepID=UPI0033B8B30C
MKNPENPENAENARNAKNPQNVCTTPRSLSIDWFRPVAVVGRRDSTPCPLVRRLGVLSQPGPKTVGIVL